jgi:hypothetical protein
LILVLSAFQSLFFGLKKMAELTQEELKKNIKHDKNGVFWWITSKQGRRMNRPAGRVNADGYIQIMIKGKRHYAHRLAWLYHFGVWPENDIDHRNGIRTDNRIENLREATKEQNQQNKGIQSNNKSGYIGVCWDKNRQKWKAQIRINYKNNHLGLFQTPEQAREAYLAAKAELHSFQPIPREIMKEGGNNG